MYKKKKKRSYGGKIVGTCVVAGCIVALLWGAGHFGLDGGLLPWGQEDGGILGGRNGGVSAQNQSPGDATPAGNDSDVPEEPDENDESAPDLIIRVVRDRIYHGEQEIDIDRLMQILDELNQPGYEWELHDDQAIVETYDNVRAIMLENGIEFVERH